MPAMPSPSTPSRVRLDFTPLRKARERRGWSQRELARLAGMHPATLNRIERNITEAPLNKVFALSRALGKPAESLYSVVE
jgi:transcriptional regulator with XRE-family HTH domain